LPSSHTRRLHFHLARTQFVWVLFLLDSGTRATVESLTLWRVRSHGVQTYLSEHAFTLDNCFEDLSFHANFVAFEIQNYTMLSHEHSTKDNVVPIDVNHIEIVVPF
jgi:hypothetical protein